jgi:hypothetical protein
MLERACAAVCFYQASFLFVFFFLSHPSLRKPVMVGTVSPSLRVLMVHSSVQTHIPRAQDLLVILVVVRMIVAGYMLVLVHVQLPFVAAGKKQKYVPRPGRISWPAAGRQAVHGVDRSQRARTKARVA